MITRENYREYDAINYSLLSQLDKNPSEVPEDKDNWSDGIGFGTLVDYMCFEPQKVEEEFYVSNADREPSVTAKLLADWILNEQSIYCNVDNDGKLQLSHDVEYGRSTLPLSDVLDEAKEAVGKSTSFKKYGGVDYLKEQIISKDKNVISQEVYNKARQAKITLKTHPFTKDYFHTNNPNVEIHFQVPMLWDPSEWDSELDCMSKSLLDIFIINHEEKTVKPLDLKTTSYSPWKFKREAIRWRYYLQNSYYYHGTLQSVKNNNKLSEYLVLPLDFIVISQKSLNNPFVFTGSKTLLEAGRDGGYIKRWDTEVRGWIQLIKDLKWHRENNKWDYPREVYENNGKIELDIFE